MDTQRILDYMETLFPDAHCELIHHNAYELLIAVMLSAQTTDAAVNKITPALFEAYPDPVSLANADLKDIETKIKRIGLYRNKAANIKACAQQLINQFHGEVPNTMETLTMLQGVGRKTANVVLGVWFNIPSMPVDTHVERISKRLGFAYYNDSVEKVEMKLKRKIERDEWNKAHHLFIFFGRYHCKAQSPNCENCALIDICKRKGYDAYLARKKRTTIKR